ncbi:MAG: cyclic nucleotide-binding domain-containing protein [Alphaproteobacteria bacterium]|nr:cyclic nucleotide-binding domain-containing protein [Alphaproteobacteria bacterium]
MTQLAVRTEQTAFRPVGRVPSLDVVDAADRSPLSRLFARRTAQTSFPRGKTLFMEGDTADTIFEIVSGVVRCYALSEDGQRQIFKFVGAGEMLGLAAMDEFRYSSEAVDDVVVRACPRMEFELALSWDPDLQGELRRLICVELLQREQHMVMLTHMDSFQRLQWFLEGFAGTARAAADGFIRLPMPRHDIGDFLGLTMETVSRMFSALRKEEYIDMPRSDRYRFCAGYCHDRLV